MLRSRIQTCVRDGVVNRVETTWDDETGNSEIREFDPDGKIVRWCDWRIWPEAEQRANQLGEAVWFDSSGAEIERRSLREHA